MANPKELTIEEKVAGLETTVEELSAKVEALSKLETTIEELSAKVEALSNAQNVATEEVTAPAIPTDIAGLGFELNKKKYEFTMPAIQLYIKNRYEVVTAAEVAESEKLQKICVDLLEKDEPTFIKLIK